jgi:5-formyltetrahydrofolate cyclo-ligase
LYNRLWREEELQMKQEIREHVLKQRRQISPETRSEYSRLIHERLFRLDVFRDAASIMAYMDFRNEVETIPVIKHCLSQGKRIVLPVSMKKPRQLLLSEVRDPEAEIAAGTFGVPEPLKEYIRPFPAEDLDLILVPAVAFDSLGYRIGYGAGYYDRFLAGLTRIIPTIGLAFEVQIIDRVPAEPTDWPVDYIITEKRLINCK